MKKMRKLRIGLLIPELLKEGGGERQCIYLAYQLHKQGHQVTIFTSEYQPDSCFPHLCQQLDIRVVGRSLAAKTNFPIYSRVKEYFDMKKMARSLNNGFDLLNPHAWPTHWAAVEAKQKYLTPVVWMCNDFMIPKVVDTSKLNPTSRINAYLANLRRSILFSYDQPIVKKIDKVVVLDNRIKSLVSQAYQADPALIRSGVDLDRFSQDGSRATELIRSKYQIKKSSFLLLSVSILLPHRRMEDIIIALKQLLSQGYDVKLLHVGSLTYDRSYSEKIVSLVNAYKLTNEVIFAGSIPEVDLPTYYQACNAFVFPNQEQTWGLAVTEAMASQKPVIVSTGAGVHEILTDGETALLVPPKQPLKLAAQIEKLMTNPELARTIAAKGYKLVASQLSWEKYASQMLGIFRQSLAARRSFEEYK
jgi:glycosyltransferase involved in cell wall biosynthesis